MDLSLYISTSLSIQPLARMPAESLVLHEENFVFGDWNDKRDVRTSFKVPAEVQNNGTLWGHFFVAQSGSPMDPTVAGYDAAKAFYFSKPLTSYLTKKKVVKTRNLLASADDAEEEVEEDASATGPTIMSYYHPNFTLSVIPDAGVQHFPRMLEATRMFVYPDRTNSRDKSGQNGWYYPIFYQNTFFQLRSQMIELNNTVKELPLNIHLNSLSHWKFNVIASVDFGMKQNAEKAAQGQAVPGGGTGNELEQIKQVLLDSNIYLLATTVIVGLLHTIFEMLAFKSDVSHWRNKKDNVGVSFRTILANVFMQTTIFLYLLDNNENTSWMILFGQGTGILLEAWKITKTVDVRVRRTPPGSRWPFPNMVTFEDKHVLSDTEKKTQEYDQIAFKYLSFLAAPLLVGYAGYSLMYDTHKSWYSFILATTVGAVYLFGFLMLTPSLYINYRLKSVAHMPGKAMMYKVLNTFIDDLFAFVISMPTLHRLATLRDDVIFFVYLYQMWAYKVDYTRMNEFGQGGDDEEIDEKLASKPMTSIADGKESEKVTEVKEEVLAEANSTGKQIKGEVKRRK